MKFILWLVVGVIFFFVWVRYIERNNIYFPTREISSTPETAGLAFEDVYLKTEDGKLLHGWFVPNEKAKFTVIFCHGNGGNISHRLEKLAFLYRLGLSAFIFDYRGYGKSEGIPSEAGLYKDGEAAYDYLVGKRRVSGDSVIVYGESLGGAVAIHLAANRKVKALITEDTFSSIKDMSKIVYPFVPTFFISSKFDSASTSLDVPPRTSWQRRCGPKVRGSNWRSSNEPRREPSRTRRKRESVN